MPKVVLGYGIGGFDLPYGVMKKIALARGYGVIIPSIECHGNIVGEDNETYVYYDRVLEDGTIDTDSCFGIFDVPRTDETLIAFVESLGEASDSEIDGYNIRSYGIVDVPDDIEYDICSGDWGSEFIVTQYPTKHYINKG